VDGNDPGTTVTLRSGVETVAVRAEARSIVPFERLEVVLDGTVAAVVQASGSPWSAKIETDIKVGEGGWLAARCYGPAGVFGHTSPICVRREETPLAVDRDAIAELTAQIDKSIEWLSRHGRFENDQQRDRLNDIFRSARAILVSQCDSGTSNRF
jgi:hypothetical protein